MNRNFQFYHNLFIFFIIALLIEGIYSAYYYKLSALIDFIPFKLQSSTNPLIWNENGLVEIFQHFFLLISCFYILKYIHSLKLILNNIYFKSFVYLYFFGLLYYFFEEISWGQHFFLWDSPEFFLKYNNQAETNFHNISNFFNEVPRYILLIWCSFSFLIVNLISKNKGFNEFKSFIFPNKNIKKISLLLLFFVIPDLIVDKLNLHPGYPIDWITEIRLYEVLDVITFNYIRLSELHELIFDYYILVHSYYLNKLNLYINKS